MILLWFMGVLSFFGGSFDRQIPLANNQANQLFESQDFQAALDAYLDAFNSDRKNGALAYNIGNTYTALGDHERAAEFYEKAMASEHTDARQLAEFNLGNLAMAQQNPNDAMQHYINYLKNQPNDIDAKRNLELALRQLEQQEQQQKQDKQDQEENQEENQDQQENQEENQDQQEQQEQQSQDQQDQNQQQNQEQQDENQDQQEQEPKDQQQSQPKEQDQPEEEKQQESKEQKDKPMDENLKKQILDALNEQELQQQKAHQKRKIGKVKRRSKDW